MKVIVPSSVGAGTRGLDLNGDGRVTIDELARSTMLVFVQLVIALSAAVWGIWVLVAGQIPAPVTLLRVEGAIMASSAIGAAALGLWRMLRYERQEREEKRDLEFERERARWEFDQVRGVSREAGATTMTQAEVDLAALQILQRYYAGKKCTREACEKDNVMGSELWNEANDMLKKRHIRRGRSRHLEPATFAKAWGKYCEGKLEANQHKMGSANDDWIESA